MIKLCLILVVLMLVAGCATKPVRANNGAIANHVNRCLPVQASKFTVTAFDEPTGLFVMHLAGLSVSNEDVLLVYSGTELTGIFVVGQSTPEEHLVGGRFVSKKDKSSFVEAVAESGIVPPNMKRRIIDKIQSQPVKAPGKYPYLAPDEIPEMAKLATSAGTPHDERFNAVRGLATSGYTEESAQALVAVACDKSVGETTRDYAAMGLSNFTGQLPEESKDLITERLRAVLEKERSDTPDGIIRTLIRWGDASFASEILGKQLQGHTMEIEVLAELPDEESSERLWQLYQSCPKSRKSAHYGRRAGIGRALADKGDTRGIDILMELLPEDSAPGGQYRHNVFVFLSQKVGQDFGYNATNYDPALEEAVTKMLLWWEDNRGSFILRSSDNRQ